MKLGRFIGLVLLICGLLAAIGFKYDLEDGSYHPKLLYFLCITLVLGISFLLFPGSDIDFQQIPKKERVMGDWFTKTSKSIKVVWLVSLIISIAIYIVAGQYLQGKEIFSWESGIELGLFILIGYFIYRWAVKKNDRN